MGLSRTCGNRSIDRATAEELRRGSLWAINQRIADGGKVNAVSFIGKRVTVQIDRPLGSTHPEHGFLYPVNYGYVPGVAAPDGEDLDAYVLVLSGPVETFTGRCIAVIHRIDDDDDKLIVVPDGTILTDAEIEAQTRFQERFFASEIIR
jgi:inorganic pyrophosphatase